jgi:hypothetical protein
MDRKLLPGHFIAIWNYQKSLNELDELMLGVLTQALYDATFSTNIDPKKYFTDAEISQIKNYRHHLEREKVNFPIVLHGFHQMADGHWGGVVDIRILKDWWDSGITSYNPETQRGTQKRIRNGKVFEVVREFQHSINEIIDKTKK